MHLDCLTYIIHLLKIFSISLYIVIITRKSNTIFSKNIKFCRNLQFTPTQFVQISQQNANRLTCKTQVRRSFIFTFTMLNQSTTPCNTVPGRSTVHCISYPTSTTAHVYLLQQALPYQIQQFCRRKYSLKVCVKYILLSCFP